MIQNRKHYACATRSRVPADRFHTETGGFLLLRITKWPNALSCLNLTGACHLSNRSDRGRDVRGDRFHTSRIPGVSGVEMKIYDTTTTTNFIENWKITNYITLYELHYFRTRQIVASSPLLGPWLARSREARFPRPNSRACSQPKSRSMYFSFAFLLYKLFYCPLYLTFLNFLSLRGRRRKEFSLWV